jgi:membrane-anchored protein YejM (alkaline phosphatase superfamily)
MVWLVCSLAAIVLVGWLFGAWKESKPRKVTKQIRSWKAVRRAWK